MDPITKSFTFYAKGRKYITKAQMKRMINSFNLIDINNIDKFITNNTYSLADCIRTVNNIILQKSDQKIPIKYIKQILSNLYNTDKVNDIINLCYNNVDNDVLVNPYKILELLPNIQNTI